MRIQIQARNVKLLREEKCWTQADLECATKAEGKAGVSVATIKRIEGEPGWHRTTSGIAESLAAALGVSVEQLVVPIDSKAYDVGGDLLVDLSGDPAAEELRTSTEKIIELLSQSKRILDRLTHLES